MAAKKPPKTSTLYVRNVHASTLRRLMVDAERRGVAISVVVREVLDAWAGGGR